MNSDFTQGDYAYLDHEGSVDPTKEELAELHSSRELNKLRTMTEALAGQIRNKKAKNRKRRKQAKRSKRKNR